MRFLSERPCLGSCGQRVAVRHKEGPSRIKAGMGTASYTSLLGVGQDLFTGGSVGLAAPGPLVGTLQESEVLWASKDCCFAHWNRYLQEEYFRKAAGKGSAFLI